MTLNEALAHHREVAEAARDNNADIDWSQTWGDPLDLDTDTRHIALNDPKVALALNAVAVRAELYQATGFPTDRDRLRLVLADLHRVLAERQP